MEKEASSDSAGARYSLCPSLSFSTVGTVKTVYFGEVEEIESRDETCHVVEELENLREVEDTDASPELPDENAGSTYGNLSILTQKASDFTNNFPEISRSISTAATSLCNRREQQLHHLRPFCPFHYLQPPMTSSI